MTDALPCERPFWWPSLEWEEPKGKGFSMVVLGTRTGNTDTRTDTSRLSVHVDKHTDSTIGETTNGRSLTLDANR